MENWELNSRRPANMAPIIITTGIVILALCGGLILFRIEARRHRPKMLDPGSYRFGVLGMVVYIVMYGILTVIEKLCFGISRIRIGLRDNLVYGPKFYWHPWNVFYEDYEGHDKET
jgi:uncharacterized membrane protein YbhN (UPF0104 family)